MTKAPLDGIQLAVDTKNFKPATPVISKSWRIAVMLSILVLIVAPPMFFTNTLPWSIINGIIAACWALMSFDLDTKATKGFNILRIKSFVMSEVLNLTFSFIEDKKLEGDLVDAFLTANAKLMETEEDESKDKTVH